ncbi:polymorphic toxin type 47 domain-containing protein [Pseudomonas chlororaphis subsp. piscium]|uniref:polymorphic toxin type 47 domain-containing protein n=1 Tax=Pseudomonas chlororaphis TaxID=587753 RepID=UPI00117A0D85
MDDPRLFPSTDGPAGPHVGYQTPSKRGGGGAVRGHIIFRISACLTCKNWSFPMNYLANEIDAVLKEQKIAHKKSSSENLKKLILDIKTTFSFKQKTLTRQIW